ncbi:hypothetical protein WR25_08375 [Diploscapter pachys]|uniref:Uncharacterized protein n=1 Tax=Diploscapter pachys TaxID=2018661 RepID=A0A2A2L2K1_9BILA|nr:hypothetical protein WR25_08375 [Diploscapter pachys]
MIAVSPDQRSQGTSVERVHGAEGADHVRVHGCAVAERLEVLLQDVVLALLVHPGGDQGVLPVLVADHDVDDCAELGGDVGSQQTWCFRDLLVVVDDASGTRIRR